MFCPKCGNQLEENAKFCAKCGYSVNQFQASAPNTGVPVHASEVPVHKEKKRKKRGIRIVVILIVLLFVMIAGVGALSGGDSDVETVKNSYPEVYKDLDTDFDEAFRNFYDSVEWKNMDEGKKNPSIVAICKLNESDEVEKAEDNKWYFDVVSKTGEVKLKGCNANGNLMSDFETQLTLKMIFDPDDKCDYNPVNDPAFADEFTDDSADIYEVETESEEEQADTSEDATQEETAEQPHGPGTIQPLNSSDYSYDDLQIYWDLLRDLQQTYGVVQWYSVYDMDADGIPELFVSYGESYDQTGEVYTLDEQEAGEIKYLGNFNGENTSLYVEEDGRVVAVYGYMGTEVLTYLYKNGDSLIVAEQPYRELGADEDYYTTPYKIEYTYTGDGAE